MLPTAPHFGPKVKCKTLYAYDAQTDTELSFNAEEILEVLDKFQGNAQYEGVLCPSVV